MRVQKSTRHAHITGQFAEHLVLYWLSKYGFECAQVDHTGIDIIARNPNTHELMGISVKSRSRTTGTEGTYVKIDRGHLPKVDDACLAFDCNPYFAIVVDQADEIIVFLLSKDHLLQLYPLGKTGVAWKMTSRAVEGYLEDSDIKIVRFQHTTEAWW